MKKVFKLLTLILVFVLTLTTTSCGKKRENYSTQKVEDPLTTALAITEAKAKVEAEKNKTFIGLYKDGVLYLENSTQLEKGEYEIITMPKENGSLPSLPDKNGGIFAGWYQTGEFKKGERVATIVQAQAANITNLHVRYISYADAGLISIVCIVIVFSMLALLWGIVSLFKFIAPKAKEEVKKTPVVTAPQKAFTMADITDDDMMAAALVATIDYHNETHENVRVVSIKEIK